MADAEFYSDLLEDVRYIFISDSCRTSKDTSRWSGSTVGQLRDLQGDSVLLLLLTPKKAESKCTEPLILEMPATWKK